MAKDNVNEEPAAGSEGPYAGKRVVYLRKLQKSGLLLVAGPSTINKVPLKRISRAYVIVTSTKVDLGGAGKLAEGVSDESFSALKNKENQEAKDKLDGVQKQIDSELEKSVGKVELMKEYLAARFSLKNGQLQHRMKF